MKNTLLNCLVSKWRRQSKQAGFTLIELLVVVTLSIMLMLAASSLFFMFLISSAKSNSVQRVKNEGEYALEQMAFLLRNAVEITPNRNGQVCELDMSEISLKSLDGGTTLLTSEYDSDGEVKIASNSGQYLTSAGVTLISGPEFDCVQSSDGVSQFITITFILQKGTPGIDEARDIVQETFTTGVNVRSF